MYFETINWVAVLVAAVLNILLGFLWYSPQVFGKAWVDALKMKEGECQCGASQYVGAFINGLIMSAVLALFINWLNAFSVGQGMLVGFFVWLGFIATTHFSGVLWARKPLLAYLIDAGYYLVNFLVLGGLLGAWH